MLKHLLQYASTCSLWKHSVADRALNQNYRLDFSNLINKLEILSHGFFSKINECSLDDFAVSSLKWI